MAAGSTDLSIERYGRRSRPQWVWIVVAVVLIGAGVAWAWWVASAQADRPVNARLQSYEVTSDRSITLTVQIYARDGAAGRCNASAQASDHSVVGERVVDLPRSDEEKYVVRTTVATQRRAVTGAVEDCRLR